MATRVDNDSALTHPSEYELDQLYLGELTGEQVIETQEHLDACLHCRKRQSLRDLGLRGFPEVDAGKLLQRIQHATQGTPSIIPAQSRRPAWVFLAPALLCAAAIVLFVARKPALESQREGIRAKGGLSFRVFKHQAPAAEEVLSGQKLVPGDRIRFVVDLPSSLSAFSEVHAMLVSHEDAGGRESVLFPSNGSGSTPLILDEEGALPIATRLDDYLGIETLVLTVCPKPFSRAEVSAAGVMGKDLATRMPDCERSQFRLQKEPR